MSSDNKIAGKDVNGDKEEEKKPDIEPLPYYKLFRYANAVDWLLVAVGILSPLAHGVGMPAMFVFFGDLTTQFTLYGRYKLCNLTYETCYSYHLTNLSQADWNVTIQPFIENFKDDSVQYCYYFVYVALIVFALGSLQVATWSAFALRQTTRIRAEYFRAILRQDIGFHDVTSSGELNSRLSSDINKVKDGIGDKMSYTIQYNSMALAGLVVGFVYSWRLSLVVLAATPFIGISSTLMMTVSSVFTTKELKAYAGAGSIAEETISAMRTVVAFGCQNREVQRYSDNLSEAKVAGIKKAFIGGFTRGIVYLTMFATYGLAYWYGSTLVIEGRIEVGNMMTSFFGILIAAFALGMGGSYMEAFSGAKAAGAKIFQVIDRNPEIDVFSDQGESPNSVNSEIRLDGVSFAYPSRPDIEILNNVSLVIEHGKTTALVGQSGCGKSTIVQLVQRFYDATAGSLTVGGRDVKALNVRGLRETIGVVAQEPVLFAASIADNIRWGRDGVSDAEVEQAAKDANAWSFISKLPKKLETLVGEGGGQMSGGQKQRIAIARAIVRNPKILLLDEATSALDTESESVVQAALEKASAGRTTVVIAHRLSTVRNAQKIVAFQGGKVAEQGTHDELMRVKKGVYRNLINMQAGRETAGADQSAASAAAKKTPDKETQVKRPPSTDLRRSSIASLKNSAISHMSLVGGMDLTSSPSGHNGTVSVAEEGDEAEMENLPEISFGRTLAMNKPEWHYMAAGCFFSLCAGSVEPINSIVFSGLLTIFTLSDPEEQQSQAIYYSMLFVALGAAAFAAYTLEGLLFGKSGMELTVRMREKAFKSMLRQDIAYFDDHKNSTGALCSRLSTDASRVQGCTGVQIGTALKNFSSLGVAIGIALVYGWKLTLLTIAFVPFIMLGGFLEMQLVMGDGKEKQENDDDAGQIALEAISNIRTVASLNKEQLIYSRYVKNLEEPMKKSTRKSVLTGLSYGYSQCVIFFAYAAVFRLGIELVITDDMTFENVFKVLFAVLFGAMAAGQNSSFAPDYAEAKLSASRMFALFDSEPAIDAYSDSGHKPAHCKGDITLKSLFFRYPTRPDLPVLRGTDVTIEAGQTLALVGQSGCGKSTTVQLLERFYDPDEGQVLLDGCDVKTLNVNWLRQQIGLVSQEPLLFDQSVKENIRYGDCSRVASMDEVTKAAREANIHDFITGTLTDKYETSVGAKGSQLSGGQKQRVAIARALLRNPKILLLDEATSALDTESEKVVQDALDAARAGRTSIVIAHRLSTVKNADKIAVIDNGVVVEEGKHAELIAKKGAYFSLVNAQLSN